jgi:hypothetical protein
VLDSLVFSAEAEVRWLDHVEARLLRRAAAAGSGRTSLAPDEADGDARVATGAGGQS